MRIGFGLTMMLALAAGVTTPPAFGAGKARHVVVMVWDGMRPDFVNETNTPTLFQLARQGVTFQNHHPVYPSSTEVNGTTLSTGGYPDRDGVLANREYRPELNPLAFVNTENIAVVRKGDAESRGKYVKLPTIAELVRKAGGKTAVAGAKPVALLADRSERADAKSGAVVFAGRTLPEDLTATLTNALGEFPRAGATNRTQNDWTTDALLGTLWKEEVPRFSLLWMNEPDLGQHTTGPGSERSLWGIRNCDSNLAKVLKALDAKGARDETDVIVVSDHGCSTVSAMVDLVDSLKRAGINATREFASPPAHGDVIVVSNAGSVLVYVIGHDEKVTQKVVDFLQEWNHTGVIFTRRSLPGTFPLDQIHLDASGAADIVVSMRWTSEKNDAGTPGMVISDVSGYGVGQGAHVSLSRFDMHNIMVAAGPDFRPGVTSVLPSGNTDVAPTVLWILGIRPPKSLDGRVLSEALTFKGPRIDSFEPRHLEVSRERPGGVWHQYLDVTEVNGVFYYDEGNGHETPK